MVRTGLEKLLGAFPRELRGARVGVLCHPASITSDHTHIITALTGRDDCVVTAVLCPDDALCDAGPDETLPFPMGNHQAEIVTCHLTGDPPDTVSRVLDNCDAVLVDLQDIGARPSSAMRAVTRCLDACTGAGIPVWILDRPNPIGLVAVDGPVPNSSSLTAGPQIPMCHRMTIAEITRWTQESDYPEARITYVTMDGWRRRFLWPRNGIPWVLPSPDLPRWETALVYPGTVLLEGTNASSGRGTTLPYELFGAPYLDRRLLRETLERFTLPGCFFRDHDFVPSAGPWAGHRCVGMQWHITDPTVLRPFTAGLAIATAMQEAGGGDFTFLPADKTGAGREGMFDRLSGDPRLREAIQQGNGFELSDPGRSDAEAAFQRTLRAMAMYET